MTAKTANTDPLLDAHVVMQLGPLTLDARLRCAAGEVVALIGPNGAGKSTMLRAIAGLAPEATGAVTVNGQNLDGVPAEDRPVGLVFQDHLLFPHLTVLDNVAFGIRRAGARRRAARHEAADWLERLGVADYAERTPEMLSGGQAQRVALARALARRDPVLLLDEPLAAVDVAGRAEVRRTLRTALAEHQGACVLVTHQPVEVLALAQRVVVLEEGQVVQDGPVEDVRARPRSPWVAEMAGVNLIEGTATADGLDLADPIGGRLAAPSPVRGPAFAVIHPRAVTLSAHRPDTSARNAWPGRVVDVDAEGDRVRVRARMAGPLDLVAEITAAAAAELNLKPGVEVWASVKATEVTVYPA